MAKAKVESGDRDKWPIFFFFLKQKKERGKKILKLKQRKKTKKIFWSPFINFFFSFGFSLLYFNPFCDRFNGKGRGQEVIAIRLK